MWFSICILFDTFSSISKTYQSPQFDLLLPEKWKPKRTPIRVCSITPLIHWSVCRVFVCNKFVWIKKSKTKIDTRVKKWHSHWNLFMILRLSSIENRKAFMVCEVVIVLLVDSTLQETYTKIFLNLFYFGLMVVNKNMRHFIGRKSKKIRF